MLNKHNTLTTKIAESGSDRQDERYVFCSKLLRLAHNTQYMDMIHLKPDDLRLSHLAYDSQIARTEPGTWNGIGVWMARNGTTEGNGKHTNVVQCPVKTNNGMGIKLCFILFDSH